MRRAIQRTRSLVSAPVAKPLHRQLSLSTASKPPPAPKPAIQQHPDMNAAAAAARKPVTDLMAAPAPPKAQAPSKPPPAPPKQLALPPPSPFTADAFGGAPFAYGWDSVLDASGVKSTGHTGVHVPSAGKTHSTGGGPSSKVPGGQSGTGVPRPGMKPISVPDKPATPHTLDEDLATYGAASAASGGSRNPSAVRLHEPDDVLLARMAAIDAEKDTYRFNTRELPDGTVQPARNCNTDTVRVATGKPPPAGIGQDPLCQEALAMAGSHAPPKPASAAAKPAAVVKKSGTDE
jgi:hypothetical protein